MRITKSSIRRAMLLHRTQHFVAERLGVDRPTLRRLCEKFRLMDNYDRLLP